MTGFIVARCRSAGRRISPAAADLLHELVEGIPNDVQRLAYTTFGRGPGSITEETVRDGMARAVLHQAADFIERYEALAPTQRRLLRALAAAPRENAYARAFLDEVGILNQNGVSHRLRRLAERELVVRCGRIWQVANPFLRAWLRESQRRRCDPPASASVRVTRRRSIR